MDNKILYQSFDHWQPQKEENYKVKALRLYNFKSFVDSGWIEFNKLTLLMGRNSVGKSSIVQALQMLSLAYDAKMSNDIFIGTTLFQKRFGGLDDCIYKKSIEKTAKISFKLMSDEKKEAEYQIVLSTQKSTETSSIEVVVDGKRFPVSECFEAENVFFLKQKDSMRPFEDSEAISAIIRTITEFASSLDYMRPSRYMPERYETLAGSGGETINESGQSAYEVLFQLAGTSASDYEKIQEWLHLFGYELEWKNLPNEKNRGEFLLYNLKTGIKTNLVDNGYGISQSLPVCVSAVVKKNGLLMIDTPEAHLQPPLESELGEFLALKKQPESSLLLETGSEYLLLRIRRLIAEKKVQSKDVTTYYIDEDDDGIIQCNKVEIDINGNIINESESYTDFFSTAAEDLIQIKQMQHRILKRK